MIVEHRSKFWRALTGGWIGVVVSLNRCKFHALTRHSLLSIWMHGQCNELRYVKAASHDGRAQTPQQNNNKGLN